MTLQKLLGNDDKSWNATSNAANTLVLQRFAATAGTLSEIRVKCTISGNIQVAIYGDNAGSPGTVLAYAMAVPVVAGWNTIPLNISIALSATNYWLAVISDGVNMLHAMSSGGTGRYKTLAFGSAFPNNPSSLVNSSVDRAIAGWGY